MSKIGRIVLVLILAIICVYGVISHVQCGANEGEDINLCRGMITIGTALPTIILIAGFLLARKYPMAIGLLLSGIGVTIFLLHNIGVNFFLLMFFFLFFNGLYFFPVAFITDGLLLIISGLLEVKERRQDEHKNILPDRVVEPSYLTQPSKLKPVWSTRKKVIFIAIGVLMLWASAIGFDFISYNLYTARTRESAINHFNRGLAYAANGDYVNAVTEYSQAIQLSPRYTEAYYNRGLAYLFLSAAGPHITDARNDFDRVIQIDPNFTMAYYYRGIFNIYGTNQPKAIHDFSYFIQSNLNNAMVYNYRGLAYYNYGDLDNAILDFDQAIQINSNLSIPYNNRGLAYARKGNLERAITDYDQAILLDPDFGAAYNNRGQAYYDIGDMALAISDWEQAVRIGPATGLSITRGYSSVDKSEIFNNLGLAYLNHGDLNTAISEFDQAIQLRPGFVLAHFNRGVAYYNKGLYRDALSDFDKGQPDYPNDTEFFFYKGLLDYYTDYPAGAIKSFYVVLTHNPDYDLLYKDWYSNFGGEGYLDRVINDFSRAIELYPNDPQTYFFRGLTYSVKGETELAITDLHTVLNLCNGNTLLCKEAQRAFQKLDEQQ